MDMNEFMDPVNACAVVFQTFENGVNTNNENNYVAILY